MAKNKLAGLMSAKTDMGSYPTSSPANRAESEARERRCRAEDALRTLTRAKEIERDRGLMRDVKSVANEQMKQLQSISKPTSSGRR